MRASSLPCTRSLLGEENGQFNRPSRFTRFDRWVGPEGLIATRKLIAFGCRSSVEHEAVLARPILQRLIRSAGVVLVLHRCISSRRHRAWAKTRVFDEHWFECEIPGFQVHRPAHVDDMQSQKAVPDRLDCASGQFVANLGQKAVSHRQHPAKRRHDANPYVGDRGSPLDSCRLDNLHTNERRRLGQAI